MRACLYHPRPMPKSRLARISRLPPETLHRLIQTRGLEDSADLVALATPQQLARVLDIDLWRPLRPGQDEQLDADRFATWLEVLMDCGDALAAKAIAAMDADLVVAVLAEHLRVFDCAAVSELAVKGLTCEIGGYLIEARRDIAWDAIVAVLLSLDANDPDCFHRVMGGCRRLS